MGQAQCEPVTGDRCCDPSHSEVTANVRFLPESKVENASYPHNRCILPEIILGSGSGEGEPTGQQGRQKHGGNGVPGARLIRSLCARR